MDKYGDCAHDGPIEVEDEAVTIKAQGGAPYDTLICEMTFKSMLNDRLCVSFQKMDIKRCDVNLYVFQEDSSAGTALVIHAFYQALNVNVL